MRFSSKVFNLMVILGNPEFGAKGKHPIRPLNIFWRELQTD